MCNKFIKYGHKTTDLWGNKNKNKGRTHFNVEFQNCGGPQGI